MFSTHVAAYEQFTRDAPALCQSALPLAGKRPDRARLPWAKR